MTPRIHVYQILTSPLTIVLTMRFLSGDYLT